MKDGAQALPHPSGDKRFKLLDAAIKRQQFRQDALIEVLHTAQETFGYLEDDVMIYLLGMAARVVIGTSLVMILAVSAATTLIQALTSGAVDIVLAGLLLVGGVIGAQYGAQLATRLKPDLLRLALAIIILLVALRMALGLAWHPDEIYTVEML